MKKFLAVIASVVLAISMLAFTGCKDKDSNPYVIEGNYKEATAEQVKTEFAKVDLSSAFGDVTANDYKLGFELSESLNLSMDTKMSMSGYTMDVNYSIGTDANYKMSFTDFENLAFSGSGYANLNGKMTVSMDKESESTSMSVKTNLYNDSDYVYVDMYETKNVEAFFGTSIKPMKLKASFEDISNAIAGAGNPEGPSQDDTITPADEIIIDGGADGPNEIIVAPGMDVDALLGMLDTLKIKVALDTENGLKAKITIDKESYDAILALAEQDAEADEMGDVLESIAALKNMLEVNTLRIDIYLAFDANGLFSAFTIDCDIDAKLKTANIPDMPVMISGDFNVKINGGISVKIYNGDITLPNGIATDSSYVDVFEVLG